MLATFIDGTREFDAALVRLESRGEADFARVEQLSAKFSKRSETKATRRCKGTMSDWPACCATGHA